MSTVLVLALAIGIPCFLGMFLFSRWCLRTIGMVMAAGAVVFALAVVWFSHALQEALERRNGPRHVFPRSSQAPFLEEPEAVERGRQALRLDGLTNGIWGLARDGRSTAPGGRADLYLTRDAQDPGRGFLRFTNAQGTWVVVEVKLDGKTLSCQRVARK